LLSLWERPSEVNIRPKDLQLGSWEAPQPAFDPKRAAYFTYPRASPIRRRVEASPGELQEHIGPAAYAVADDID
jgi:hypothetical protein